MQTSTLTVLELIEINQPEPPQETRQPGKPFLCRHIFTDGRRCGSPALRAQHFCYYHYAHRTPVLARHRRRQPGSGFDLTLLDGLDNPTAIQLALSDVLIRIAENTLDPRRAWLLIHGLQVAARNLRHCRPSEDPLPTAIIEDDAHGQLAEPEPGRDLPPTTLDRMRAVLHARQSDPNFPIPDEFKGLLPDPEPTTPTLATKVQTSPTRSPDLTPTPSRL